MLFVYTIFHSAFSSLKWDHNDHDRGAHYDC